MSMLGKMAMGMVMAKVTGNMMGGSSSSSGGGIGDILGGLMGASKGNSSPASQGGIGDLLSSLIGGSSSTTNSGKSNDNGLGGLLSAALSGKEIETTPSQEEQAKVLLKAMINAAKADGHIDKEEQAKIVEYIGEVSEEELAFVRQEMEAPLDIEGIIEQAKGIEGEVYLSSLMTIKLDSKEEALYLDKLAQGLNISRESVDALHEKVGAPKLYS